MGDTTEINYELHSLQLPITSPTVRDEADIFSLIGKNRFRIKNVLLQSPEPERRGQGFSPAVQML